MATKKDDSITIKSVAAALFPKVEEFKKKPTESGKKLSDSSTPRLTAPTAVESKDLMSISTDDEENLPEIRIRAEVQGEKVKKFATAQGASIHLKVMKAKRIGLTALHKTVSWLTPNKK